MQLVSPTFSITKLSTKYPVSSLIFRFYYKVDNILF